MELPLVVGVDGSESSLLAVDWAVDEAARHGLRLRLVHGSRWERYERALPPFTTGRPAGEVMGRNILAACAERARLRDPAVKVSEEMRSDGAVSALLYAAPEAYAVVVGERGRGELSGLLLGSVSLAVAARAVCPVVVVRGARPDGRGPHGRVVVGVGHAAEQAGAVEFAAREAEARGWDLIAVRAWRRPADDRGDGPGVRDEPSPARDARASLELGDALRETVRNHPRLSVQRHIVEGPAHRVLLDAAADAGLVVVGAARRHGRFGLQLGRAAHVLLHHSACPVAVVPQRV
ncbi:universal stress protein [Streptomyces sp. NPDC001914]|uniref:universal stress protein n=1 Tax=Streptomyces sp. NPDC001914 TaxID=3364623 RepID=UPI00367DF400